MHLNLLFLLEKLHLLRFCPGQHLSSEILKPFFGKNDQSAGRFREERLGKLGKIEYFGHIGNHKIHLEH